MGDEQNRTVSATTEETAPVETGGPPPRRRSRRRWLLLTAFVVAGWFLWIGARGPAIVEPGTVLVLDLRAGLRAEAPGRIEQFLGASPFDLLQLHEALEAALVDSRVDGVLLRLGAGDLGGAMVEEIGARLEDVRRAGKFVVAFISGADTLNYLLATAADEVIQDATTYLNTTGLRLTTFFFKDLLEKYGASADFVRVGKYKGTFEQFSLPGPTEETSRAMNDLADSLFERVIETIGERRELKESQVRSLIDRSPLTAEDARDEKLVDSVLFSDELDARLEALLDERSEHGEHRELHLLTVEEYAARTVSPVVGPHFAVVHVSGTIVEGESRDLTLTGEACGAATVVRALDEAIKNPDVRGILLRIDSPGGLVTASERIWRAVDSAARRKPLVASLGNTAASGGYYAACAADKVLAQALSLTGSIGIFGGKVVLRDLLARHGVNVRTYARGRHASMFDLDRPFLPEERLHLERMLEGSYAKFLERVVAKRAVPAAEIESAAQGRVWSGHQARQIGLVDSLGGFSEALGELRRSAGVVGDAPLGLRAYPARPTFWELFARTGSGLAKARLETGRPLDRLRAWVGESGFFNSLRGLALMPWALELR